MQSDVCIADKETTSQQVYQRLPPTQFPNL